MSGWKRRRGLGVRARGLRLTLVLLFAAKDISRVGWVVKPNDKWCPTAYGTCNTAEHEQRAGHIFRGRYVQKEEAW